MRAYEIYQKYPQEFDPELVHFYLDFDPIIDFMVENDMFIPHDYKVSMPFEKCCFEIKKERRLILISTKEVKEDDLVSINLLKYNNRTAWRFIGSFGCRLSTAKAFRWDNAPSPSHLDMLDVRSLLIHISFFLDNKIVSASPIQPKSSFNKKRAKNRKIPFFEYKELKISPFILEQAELHRQNEQKHKSPRWHKRRGHWRRLKNKSVFIRDTAVGKIENGIVFKDYIISTQHQRQQEATL